VTTTSEEQNAILIAVATSEAKMMATLDAGLKALQISISALGDQHHAAVLAQERRNSEFAPRDRLEQIASRVHDQGNALTANRLLIDQLSKKLDQLSDQLTAIERAFANRSLDLFGGLASWAGMALIMVACALLTWFLTSHVGVPK
jgi:hypothetical protein